MIKSDKIMQSIYQSPLFTKNQPEWPVLPVQAIEESQHQKKKALKKITQHPVIKRDFPHVIISAQQWQQWIDQTLSLFNKSHNNHSKKTKQTLSDLHEPSTVWISKQVQHQKHK